MYRNLQDFILASSSPRRRELLESVGLTFEVVPSGIEEVEKPGESPIAQAERWATEKAMSVLQLRPGSWVLSADTIVILEGTIFGKPENPHHATSMLARLSGKAHEVISAVTLAHGDLGFLAVKSVQTQVVFRELSEEEIMAYVRSGEPLDKAGAYGIQGIGASLVRSISGSYTNVVGLPLCETIQWLLENGVITPA